MAASKQGLAVLSRGFTYTRICGLAPGGCCCFFYEGDYTLKCEIMHSCCNICIKIIQMATWHNIAEDNDAEWHKKKLVVLYTY